MENVHFFAVIEQIYIRCTFINTVSCDEQHGYYRIVLTYVNDDLEAFLQSWVFSKSTLSSPLTGITELP